MKKLDANTKEKILQSAEYVFHLQGFKGARTTLIAQNAGISRTMLHYYFSTKEALFQEVLKNSLGTIIKHLQELIEQEEALIPTIESLIKSLFELFENKPSLPNFIVNMINEIPDISLFLIATHEDDIPSRLQRLVEKGQEEGKIIKGITGEDIMLNIYAMCSAPYLLSPYIKTKSNRDAEEMRSFLEKREQVVRDFIIKGIQV